VFYETVQLITMFTRSHNLSPYTFITWLPCAETMFGTV